MGFGERLRTLRERRGFSQTEFARRLNVSSSAVSHFESGKNYPRFTVLFNIFEILECDANYLFQDYLVMKHSIICETEERELIETYRRLDPYGKKLVLAVVRAVCRESRELADLVKPQTVSQKTKMVKEEKEPSKYILRSLMIPRLKHKKYLPGGSEKIWIRNTDVNARSNYCIKVIDHRMEPYYKPNDILLIQKAAIKDDEIGLFQWDGSLCIARLKMEGRKKKLIPLHAKLEPFVPTREKEVKILGKIIGKVEENDYKIK